DKRAFPEVRQPRLTRGRRGGGRPGATKPAGPRAEAPGGAGPCRPRTARRQPRAGPARRGAGTTPARCRHHPGEGAATTDEPAGAHQAEGTGLPGPRPAPSFGARGAGKADMPSTTPPTGTAPYLRRRLWLFAASCLLITWLPWTALAAVGADVDEGLAMPVFTLAACGPSLAALAMWLRHRRELPRDRVRVVAAWPLLSVLLGAAPMLLVSVLAHWNGLEAIPRHAASVAAGVGGPAGVVAYTLLA